MTDDEMVNALIACSKMGREMGIEEERDRTIKLAENRICFDHKAGCDHAACYALSDLIKLIEGDHK